MLKNSRFQYRNDIFNRGCSFGMTFSIENVSFNLAPVLRQKKQGPGLTFSIKNESFKPGMKCSSQNGFLCMWEWFRTNWIGGQISLANARGPDRRQSGKEKTNKHKHFGRDGVRDKQEPSLGQMGPLRAWVKLGPVPGTNRPSPV